jgi:membrane protein required for colicin V production
LCGDTCPEICENAAPAGLGRQLMLDWSTFNWFDWAILATVGLSTLMSLWRGFVREAMSLLGWVAAFVLAALFSDALAQAMVGWIDNDSARHVAAYVLLFLAVLVIANICSFLLKQLVRITGLSTLDRILGTAFGFARGVVVVLVFVLLARELATPDNLQWMYASQLMPHIELLVHWVESVFGQLDFGWVPGISVGEV